MIRICFVCLGNICRSPTAEGVMLHLIEQHQLNDKLSVDSAGTSGWHEGSPADSRSQETAQGRGIVLHSRSRRFIQDDFRKFDYIIAMDKSNLGNMLRLARTEQDRSKLSLLRQFDAASPKDSDVPDPYYGGPQGFDQVFDICMAGCEGLLKYIRKHHQI